MKCLNQIMFDMIKASAPLQKTGSCAGGFHLMVKPGSYLKKGECWAKMHHNVKLDENQILKLHQAVTFSDEPLKMEHSLDIKEFQAGSFKAIQRARLSMPNIFGHEGTQDPPSYPDGIVEEEHEEEEAAEHKKPHVHFEVADSDDSEEEKKKNEN